MAGGLSHTVKQVKCAAQKLPWSDFRSGFHKTAPKLMQRKWVEAFLHRKTNAEADYFQQFSVMFNMISIVIGLHSTMYTRLCHFYTFFPQPYYIMSPNDEIAQFYLCPISFLKIVPPSGHYPQQKNSPAFLFTQKSVKMTQSNVHWRNAGGTLSGKTASRKSVSCVIPLIVYQIENFQQTPPQ